MFEVIAIFLLGIQIIIFLYFVTVNGTYTAFTILSIRELIANLIISNDRRLKNILSSMSFYRPISIIVPSYNEEKTIVSNIRSLLSLHFPEFEVIIVNDGSTDKTLEILVKEFNLIQVPTAVRLVLNHKQIRNLFISIDHPNLIVVDKVNGGKADAINAGINVSQFPLFCCIDADSVLEPEALLRASRLFFEDREVIATGGVVLPVNGCKVEAGTISELKTPKKILELLQAVEYIRGFLSGRTGWSKGKSLLIISGAFGVFRKDLVMEIGGYRHTVGEDMDLVVRLHKHCLDNKIKYKILFVPDPVCYTQVPSDLPSLLKQRNRWHRGLIDSLIFSKKMFFNPKYGAVGLIGFPYFVFVEALGPIIEFTGYFGFVVFYFLGYLSKEFAFLFFLFAFIWGMWINISAVLLDNFIYRRYRGVKDILKLCIGGVIEFLGYRQLIAAERIIATFQFWKKGWGKPKREKIEHEEAVRISR